jgi:hypothetical protein
MEGIDFFVKILSQGRRKIKEKNFNLKKKNKGSLFKKSFKNTVERTQQKSS